MPLYSYNCEHCHYTFDKISSLEKRNNEHCPYCGRIVRKVFGSIPSIFIGSGFYVNDYKNKKVEN